MYAATLLACRGLDWLYIYFKDSGFIIKKLEVSLNKAFQKLYLFKASVVNIFSRWYYELNNKKLTPNLYYEWTENQINTNCNCWIQTLVSHHLHTLKTIQPK